MTPFQRYLSLAVGRLDRATPLAATTGLPRKVLVFADDGSIQAIDANGVLRNITSSGGSLIPTDDNVDDLGSLALRWRVGFFGTTVSTPAIGVPVAGAVQAVATINSVANAVNGLALTSTATLGTPSISATGSDTNISLGLAAQGTGVIALTSPETITPGTATSGTQTALAVIGAPNTGQDAGGDVPDVIFALDRTVTFQTGPVAVQDAVKIKAPTYAAAAASVFSDVSTLTIDAAPSVTAPSTATRRQTLWVQAGLARFDGGIGQTGANTGSVTVLDLQRLVNAGAVGANNIAASVTLSATNAAGAPWTVGFLTATMSDATTGAAHFSLGGAFGGAECEALRLVGLAGVITNRIDITPAADSGIVTVAVTGGATAGSLALSCNGTAGVTSLRGSVATNIIAVDNGGGASAPRVGFFNVTPLERPTVADCVPAVDGTSAGTQLNALLAQLRLYGLLT